jgi:hypothetical protein
VIATLLVLFSSLSKENEHGPWKEQLVFVIELAIRLAPIWLRRLKLGPLCVGAVEAQLVHKKNVRPSGNLSSKSHLVNNGLARMYPS